MKTIAVKQKALEISQPPVPNGNLSSPADWMDCFLDFEISKLEKCFLKIRAGMDAKLAAIDRHPIWS
jgi:hypothetical protein